MPVDAVGYVGAAVIAAGAAVVGMVLGKEQKTTEFRQDWINAQRNDLARLISIARNADYRGPRIRLKTLADFDETLTRVELRENPDRHEWQHVLESLHRLREALIKSHCRITIERGSVDTVEQSQRLLKIEWNRVRNGEPWFRYARWILPVLIFIVGLTLAYGKDFIVIGRM